MLHMLHMAGDCPFAVCVARCHCHDAVVVVWTVELVRLWVVWGPTMEKAAKELLGSSGRRTLSTPVKLRPKLV